MPCGRAPHRPPTCRPGNLLAESTPGQGGPMSAAALSFPVSLRQDPLPVDQREAVLASPGFGKTFTDHMVLATWSAGRGWHDGKVTAYGPLQLDPSAAVLHYAQEIFEGLKAYRHADGSIWTFRPEANAARFARSADRLALPVLPEEDFLESLRALVTTDEAWVPAGDGGEGSLYLRPFMFASEAFLGVRPATEVTYCVIASPAGPYFAGGLKPVSIWLSTAYTRAAPPARPGAARPAPGGSAPPPPPPPRGWGGAPTAATRWPSSTRSSAAG